MTNPVEPAPESEAAGWLLPINALLLAALVVLPAPLLRMWRPWDFDTGESTMSYWALIGLGFGVLAAAWSIVHFFAPQSVDAKARELLSRWGVTLALVLVLGAIGLGLGWIRQHSPLNEPVLRLLPYGLKLTKQLPLPNKPATESHLELVVGDTRLELDTPHRKAIYVGRPERRLRWLHRTQLTNSPSAIALLLADHDPASSPEARAQFANAWLASPPQVVETPAVPRTQDLQITLVRGSLRLPLKITRAARGADNIDNCLLEAQ